MDIKTEFQKVWTNFRTELEEFSLQFTLGKTEAKEQSEVFLKDFNAQLKDWQEKIKKYEKDNEPLIKEIRQEIDTFRVQVALGKAETKEQVEEYAERVRTSIQKLTDNISEKIANDKNLKEDWEKVLTSLNLQASKLKGNLDAIRLQMSLGEAEAKENFEIFKKEFSKKFSEFQQTADKQFDENAQEMKTWFDKMQKIVADKLSSKK
jgi:cysteine sulfinate desulfinase/cysteine desulfurase-like protein